MKSIWNAIGDIRVAFVLLIAASATLFTGALYAGGNFSLFHELNRHRIQDWLPGQLSSQPDLVWWIPLLFFIMGLLGLNTFACATTRMARLIRQRHSMAAGRFMHLLMPSMVHLLFIMIMIGHLTTFTTGEWQTLPLVAGKSVSIDSMGAAYQVQDVADRFFPDTSAMRDRIAQTTVTLVDANREIARLQYTRPACLNGHFFLLDKAGKKQKRTQTQRIMPSATEETCNKALDYVETGQSRKGKRQLLLVVNDPGLPVIITGLTLIMVLMIGYLSLKPKVGR
ncbi:uncharacterized protein Dvar_47300 [Desulfosarcina variabilis str. Montpellier]|uniref:hypothetical protein n=1 Tax=Desulfosarcina variabilis TaxID=2300 RepID=UPI003AFB14FA